MLSAYAAVARLPPPAGNRHDASQLCCSAGIRVPFAGTPPGDASEKPDHRSDLYYREDRKAENPQPHMPVRQDTDTDNMFEYLDIIYSFLMMSLITNPLMTAMPPSPP